MRPTKKPPKTFLGPRPNKNQFSGSDSNANTGGGNHKNLVPRNGKSGKGGRQTQLLGYVAPGSNASNVSVSASKGVDQKSTPMDNRGDKNNGSKPKGLAGAAQRAVNSQIRQGVKELRRDRRVVRRQANRDRSQVNADYERSLGDLNYLYGETSDYVDNMNQQIDQNYSDQASRTEQAQKAFVAQLQANSQSVGGGLNNELSRLGLQGVNTSQFAADSQNALNVANQTGLNNQVNIDFQRQGADTIGDLLGGMIKGSHLSQQGQAMNSKNDMMFQIFQNKSDGLNEVSEAIRDLRNSRGDLTRQMMEQLANSGWGRYLMRGRGNGGGNGRGGRSFSSSDDSGGRGSYSGSSSGWTSHSPGGGNNGGPKSGSGLNDLLLAALNNRGPNEGRRIPRRNR